MRRSRSLVFSQNTWITICWKVIVEFFAQWCQKYSAGLSDELLKDQSLLIIWWIQNVSFYGTLVPYVLIFSALRAKFPYDLWDNCSICSLIQVDTSWGLQWAAYIFFCAFLPFPIIYTTKLTEELREEMKHVIQHNCYYNLNLAQPSSFQ